MKKKYNSKAERLAARRASRRDNFGRTEAEYKNKFIQISEEHTCHLWTGCKWKNGYGYVRIKGKCVPAHRYIYELYRVKIPKGYDLLHICDNPSCVNPQHLVPGTHTDNMRDMVAKGRNANFKGKNNPNYKHGKYTKDQT